MKICFTGYGSMLLTLALGTGVSHGQVTSQDATRSPQTAKQAVEPASAGVYTLRTTVNRVILDVVVTDAQGKPIRGLTRDAFTVKEDNTAQSVLSFDAHPSDAGMDYTPVSLPPHPANTFVNLPSTPERGPLYVLFYDLANIPQEDQPYARKQLVKFIKEKPEGTRFAIFVSTDGMHLIQGFTSDKQVLFEAIDPKSSRPHIPMIFLMGANYGGDGISSALELTYIARYLSGMPGRKNLIWMASAFPLSLFPKFDDPITYREAAQKAIDALAANQVAVYPVDTQGVVISEIHAPGSAGLGGGGSSGSSGGGGSGGSGGGSGASGGGSVGGGGGGTGASILSGGYMNEEQIARETGGHAYYSTNDMRDALEKATEVGSAYYTLSYAPTDTVYNGKERKIHVEATCKGCQLSYRHTYYGSDPDAPLPSTKPAKIEAVKNINGGSAASADDALSSSMQHGAPVLHQLIFAARLKTVGPPTPGTPEQMAHLANLPAFARHGHHQTLAKPLSPIPLQTYAIDYTVTSHQFVSMGETSPSIIVAAAAYDADGTLLNALVSVETEADRSPSGVATPHPYRMEERLAAPLAAKFIRVAVRDAATDRTGAMEITLPLAPENTIAQVH